MKLFYTILLTLPLWSLGQTNKLSAAGNVGIGTTIPQDLLVVETGILRQGISILSEGTNFVFSDLQFTIKGSSNMVAGKPFSWKISHRKDGYFSDNVIGESSLEFYGDIQGGTYYAPLSFKSSGDVILVSNKNAFAGNVGIGTTMPKEKLSVNGNIRAQAIKVETTNWPDYVFDKNYEMLSLSDLNAYITKNKRLPEMPSAQEIGREGHDLGEINKLLLKKIEELTLYIINQDKKFSEKLEEINLKIENK